MINHGPGRSSIIPSQIMSHEGRMCLGNLQLPVRIKEDPIRSCIFMGGRVWEQPCLISCAIYDGFKFHPYQKVRPTINRSMISGSDFAFEKNAHLLSLAGKILPQCLNVLIGFQIRITKIPLLTEMSTFYFHTLEVM